MYSPSMRACRLPEPITDWLETNPGDNIPPKVRSVAWLAYDDDFFYAAFEFDEPDPRTIRAPLGDRDNVRSYTDYGGVILDSQNDGHTAQLFLANARGIQYDALSNDASRRAASSVRATRAPSWRCKRRVAARYDFIDRTK